MVDSNAEFVERRHHSNVTNVLRVDEPICLCSAKIKTGFVGKVLILIEHTMFMVQKAVSHKAHKMSTSSVQFSSVQKSFIGIKIYI